MEVVDAVVVTDVAVVEVVVVVVEVVLVVMVDVESKVDDVGTVVETEDEMTISQNSPL